MAGRERFDWLVGWRGVQHTICGLAHTEAGENLDWRQTGGGWRQLYVCRGERVGAGVSSSSASGKASTGGPQGMGKKKGQGTRGKCQRRTAET
jgi:hypothetical protein